MELGIGIRIRMRSQIACRRFDNDVGIRPSYSKGVNAHTFIAVCRPWCRLLWDLQIGLRKRDAGVEWSKLDIGRDGAMLEGQRSLKDSREARGAF